MNDDQHTHKKLIKRGFRRPLAIALVAAILMAALGGGVIYAGLATRDVGKISGELVITDVAGVKQAVLDASQTLPHLTQPGQASVELKKDGVRIFTASATVKATSQEDAAGGITALMLFLTGREPVDRTTLQISNIQFGGDINAIKNEADKIISWWDAKAKLAFDNYKSPILTLDSLGKLQLNAWTIRPEDGHFVSSFVILYFDSADPTKIVGGLVERAPVMGCCSTFSVTSGSLTERTTTSAPGDFTLFFEVDPGGNTYSAELALDVLADGTIDLRGVSRNNWPFFSPANYILEGTGNAKFVVPNQ